MNDDRGSSNDSWPAPIVSWISKSQFRWMYWSTIVFVCECATWGNHGLCPSIWVVRISSFTTRTSHQEHYIIPWFRYVTIRFRPLDTKWTESGSNRWSFSFGKMWFGGICGFGSAREVHVAESLRWIVIPGAVNYNGSPKSFIDCKTASWLPTIVAKLSELIS